MPGSFTGRNWLQDLRSHAWQSKTTYRFIGKMIFVTELTSLCQAMLTTTTNSVSLVTHADTHDQDQEEKMVKQIHQVRSSSGAWNDAQLNPAACVK